MMNYMHDKEELVQYVLDLLDTSKIVSPLTMIIEPAKYGAYFVYIATDMSLEDIAEIQRNYSYQPLTTSQENTPAG